MTVASVAKSSRGSSSRRFRPAVEVLEDRCVPSAGTTLDPVIAGVNIQALLTTGTLVPRTGFPGQQYRMVGVPDGLGAFDAGDGTVQLFMNHELRTTVPSEPIVGAPTFMGSFVSKYILDKNTGAVLSGDVAFSTVVNGTNSTPVSGAFGRFCSGFLGGPAQGLDRMIYFAGEENTASGTFDGKGGQGVAIFDGVAHILPELGHFEKENLLVMPNTGNQTVILSTEDNGSLTSQVYMYVGNKVAGANDPLIRNGLVGGKLYVLTGAGRSEANFHKGDGTVGVGWAEIPNPASLTDVQLEAAAQARGSFNFVRVEDGAFDPTNPSAFYFITTGTGAESPINPDSLGRLFRLVLDPSNPLAGGRLTTLLEGDRGDPLVNPDNIDINSLGQMIILEDPNFPEHNGGNAVGDAFWASRGNRDSSVFLYDLRTGDLARIAQIDRAGNTPAGDNAGTKGSWESSGVIDVSAIFGPGTWLLDVQAHTILNSNNQVGREGGQLLRINTASVFYRRFATGADAGGSPQVNLYDASGNMLRAAAFAFPPNFTGGVRVAIGDITGDGVPDVIAAAGPGGGPQVIVLDGLTMTQIAGPLGSFFAFDSRFTGGVYLAVGDVNGDGRADIICGAGEGGGPQVTVFSGRDGSIIKSFFAFGTSFTGGVRVAAGDFNGDARADIVAAAGPGGLPQVTVFSGAADNAVLLSFFAFDGKFSLGLNVAVGDVNGDFIPDIIVGAGAGGLPQVSIYDGRDARLIRSFYAFDQSFTGGVRVRFLPDINGNGRPEVIAAAGRGTSPQTSVFDSSTLALLGSFFAYNPRLSGGLFV